MRELRNSTSPSPRTSRRLPFAVIGAGLAGASCAAALARRGVPVILLETERTPGQHSSGRNAGLVRQATEDPVISTLCREGASAIRARGVPFRPTGSILVDPHRTIASEVWDSIDAREIPAAALERRIPWLAGGALEGAVETVTDGIVEVHALLESYLSEVREGGGEIRCGEPALRPQISDGRVVAVETSHETMAVEGLVIATGAWGAEWGERGAVPIALEPTRRSLIQSSLPVGASEFPWVWHLDEGWYFRPESGGLLWCAGEEFPDRAGEAKVDPLAPERLAARVARHLPAVTGVTPGRHWAGHRTFCPDRRFLLGPDPRLAGWHWAVGLGGHGVTTSFAVGERVARAIVAGTTESIEPELAWREAVVPPLVALDPSFDRSTGDVPSERQASCDLAAGKESR